MQDFKFLKSAVNATTIIFENVNLTKLVQFPMLPKLQQLYVGAVDTLLGSMSFLMIACLPPIRHLSNGLMAALPTGLDKLSGLERL